MVFKKIKNTESTFIYMPELAVYNAELGDIVLLNDEFFQVIDSGFKEIKFIFHLENQESNGI